MSIPLDWTGTHLVRTTLLTLMLAAGVSACLDPLASGLPPDDGTPYCPVTSGLSSEGVTGYRATTRVTGYWIFHFDAPAVNDHVQLVRVTRADTSDWLLQLSVFPARDWSGNVTQDLDSARSAGRLVIDSARSQGHVEWRLSVAGVDGVLRYTCVNNAAHGVFTPLGDTVAVHMLGVPVDTLMIPSLDSTPRAPSTDSTPVVLLRVDDAPVTDRDFLGRVLARSLPAELGIPTKLVGRSGMMTWADVNRWTASGFTTVAHSLLHRATATDEECVAEFAGSLADMAAHGVPTTVFVQPGTWRDSMSFDAAAKLRNWRGALIRSLSTVFESYVYNGSQCVPFPDSVAYGLGHVTISNGVTPDVILQAWLRATQPRHATVFLVHSRTVRPAGMLDWFLDTLASARASGRIRVVGSVQELFPH